MKIGAAAAVALSLAACGGSGELDDRSSAAVYANVIWALVEQNDASSPAAPVFVERGGLTAEQQRVIERMLADLPTLDFVADGRSVLIDTGCPQVREDGALVTLGPISGGSERVTVRGELFVACLGAITAVWILEPDGDDWRVTGTEGPIGIS